MTPTTPNVPTLTAEQVRAMEAGRELDMYVAQHVMGWRWYRLRSANGVTLLAEESARNIAHLADFRNQDAGRGTPEDYIGPGFSSDIAAAWQVVEKLRDLGWLLTIKTCYNGYIVNGQQYRFTESGRWQDAVRGRGFVQQEGDTMPHAVALVALLVVLAKGGPA